MKMTWWRGRRLKRKLKLDFFLFPLLCGGETVILWQKAQFASPIVAVELKKMVLIQNTQLMASLVGR